MSAELNIRPALLSDAVLLSKMLESQREAYVKYYQPFSFEPEVLRDKICNSRADRYWIIMLSDQIAGFFMLRGFDEGYVVPSFGVIVPEMYAGKGISTLALSYVLTWCASNNIDEVMLKVHPDNINAKKMYERWGFTQSGVDVKNDNIVMRRFLRKAG